MKFIPNLAVCGRMTLAKKMSQAKTRQTQPLSKAERGVSAKIRQGLGRVWKRRGRGLCEVCVGSSLGFRLCTRPTAGEPSALLARIPQGPGFPLPPGAQPTPWDAPSPLTCLPGGAAVLASSKAKLVTEGRSPVGLAVTILPVVTHLPGSRGERHQEGSRVRMHLPLGQC